jgi:lysozyme
MNRYFADISNNNTQTVNWTEYKKVGQHVLVGLKATEGESFIDKTHASRSEGAHSAGVHVLHYHFGHPNKSAKEQAQFFWGQIKGHFAKRDFACIDIEVSDGMPNAAIASWVRGFAGEFKRVSTHSLIAYSSESFAHSIGNCGITRWWVAAYGGPGVPPAGASQWAHQFTDGSIGPQPHSCAGIGNCDVSQLNWGTYGRLRLTKP